MKKIALFLYLTAISIVLSGCITSDQPFYSRSEGVSPFSGNWGLHRTDVKKDNLAIAKQAGTFYNVGPEKFREAILVPLPRVPNMYIAQHYYEEFVTYSLVMFKDGERPDNRAMVRYSFVAKNVAKKMGISLVDKNNSSNIAFSTVKSREDLETIFQAAAVFIVDEEIDFQRQIFNMYDLQKRSEYDDFFRILDSL